MCKLSFREVAVVLSDSHAFTLNEKRQNYCVKTLVLTEQAKQDIIFLLYVSKFGGFCMINVCTATFGIIPIGTRKNFLNH